MVFILVSYDPTLSNFISSLVENKVFINFRAAAAIMDTTNLILYRRASSEKPVNFNYTYINNDFAPKSCTHLFAKYSICKWNSVSIAICSEAQYRSIDTISSRPSKNYTRLRDIEVFLEQHKLSAIIIYCSSTNSSLIIQTEFTTAPHLPLLSSRLLPGLFADIPLTANETALLSSIAELGNSLNVQALDSVLDEYGIKNLYYTSAVSNAITSYNNSVTLDISSKLKDLDDEINKLSRSLNRCLSEQTKLNTILGSLQPIEVVPDIASRLIEYLANNKSVKLQSIINSSINYTVTTTADYFDGDIYQTYRNNRYSAISRQSADLLQILDAIFLTRSIKLAIYSSFSIGIDNTFKIRGDVEYTPADHLANPHIMRYQCLGTNSSEIYANLRSSNYILAIEQSIAATKNINITDSVVFTDFMKKLKQCTRLKCYRLPDGTHADFQQTLNWLKQNIIKQEECSNGNVNVP